MFLYTVLNVYMTLACNVSFHLSLLIPLFLTCSSKIKHVYSSIRIYSAFKTPIRRIQNIVSIQIMLILSIHGSLYNYCSLL
jgi:hypothetical protein